MCKARSHHNFDNVLGADTPTLEGGGDGEVYQDDEVHDCSINSTLIEYLNSSSLVERWVHEVVDKEQW